jgi:acetyl-CoA decarbonylase/synthase complex subunit gamma
MRYKIEPGLYALGRPDDRSEVFVTANYKMSFDRLREALPGRDAWVLVLDTKGINVWCAAGKGTFGTEELAGRIHSSGLGQVVSHRELILPQLAGPGVAAHQVQKLSGFKVIYGPIRAKDLGAFLDAGQKASPEMRRKTFTAMERTVLAPGELVAAMKFGLFILPLFFFLGGLGGPGHYWMKAWNHGLFAVQALLCAILAGTVLTPLLLPFLPGRAFSFKGFFLGVVAALVLVMVRAGHLSGSTRFLEILAWFFIVPAVAAYLAMNFTGCSTYTSLSGVKKEMRLALPLEITVASLGIVLWVGSRFLA